MLRRTRIIRPTQQKRKRANYFVIKNYRKETQTELSLSKSTLTFSFISSANELFCTRYASTQ